MTRVTDGLSRPRQWRWHKFNFEELKNELWQATVVELPAGLTKTSQATDISDALGSMVKITLFFKQKEKRHVHSTVECKSTENGITHKLYIWRFRSCWCSDRCAENHSSCLMSLGMTSLLWQTSMMCCTNYRQLKNDFYLLLFDEADLRLTTEN